MHPMQDYFLESFSQVLIFDMHFYMHSYLHKNSYSCKKWVLQNGPNPKPKGPKGWPTGQTPCLAGYFLSHVGMRLLGHVST
jgi:hypothetical protein